MTANTNTSTKKSYNLRGELTSLEIRPTQTGGQMVVCKIQTSNRLYSGLMTAPRAVEKFLATGVEKGAKVFATANFQPGKGRSSVRLTFMDALLPPKVADQAAA